MGCINAITERKGLKYMYGDCIMEQAEGWSTETEVEKSSGAAIKFIYSHLVALLSTW